MAPRGRQDVHLQFVKFSRFSRSVSFRQVSVTSFKSHIKVLGGGGGVVVARLADFVTSHVELERDFLAACQNCGTRQQEVHTRTEAT